jgi:redox-sensitive bicupin YhaK (pirin superfamily)
MVNEFNKSFNNVRPPHKGGPSIRESTPILQQKESEERPATYTKVFRWRLPEGQAQEPATVEIVGSFTHWQKLPMMRDSALDAWHVTIHHIPGHRTHHYMFLVDGKPAHDRHCDGLAIPHGPQEEQFQIETARGPRVFMLFAQTK